MFTAATADCPDVGQNLASLSKLFAASADRGFEFQKRGQQFIRTTKRFPGARVSAVMCVCNPDRSSAGINR